MQKRNFKPFTITIPPEELEAAKAMLPYGEIYTLSGLFRLGVKKLPKKAKR